MDPLRKGIAIGMLFGSGGHGNLMTKTATENGVYTAAEETDPETGEIFDPPKDGYSVFTIDLPLDDKFVTIVTSAIESSSTGIFEYDPHDENPELEGYSLFRLDLTGVKTDIAEFKQQIADLEDELEACHDCRDEVVAALQQYDPDYDPDEGECPADKVTEVVEHAEECDDCKAEVVAKLQEYDPDFDPVTCQDIVDKIDEIEEEAEKPPQYTFEQDPTSPTYPDPDFPDKIRDIIGNDNLTDDDVQIEIRYVHEPHPSGYNAYYGFYSSVDGSFIGRTPAFASSYVEYYGFKILDYTTGEYEYYMDLGGGSTYHYTYTDPVLIGYGDPTHSYTVSKNS